MHYPNPSPSAYNTQQQQQNNNQSNGGGGDIASTISSTISTTNPPPSSTTASTPIATTPQNYGQGMTFIGQQGQMSTGQQVTQVPAYQQPMQQPQQQQQQQQNNSNNQPTNYDSLYLLVSNLSDPTHREEALVELSRMRESYPDLAPILWQSVGTMAALLQEIVQVYPLLDPPRMEMTQSNRVCNALALLQCVAAHSDTRRLFLQANIPMYLYPFLNTQNLSEKNNRPFDFLRLTSLGVIGALVKVDDSDVINFLLNTEIISLCLEIMSRCPELPQTVATFIVSKILQDNQGLQYICQNPDRFFAVANVLKNMVNRLQRDPAPRLLKHIIRCYLRLSQHKDARDALRTWLPEPLQNDSFESAFDNDPSAIKWFRELHENVYGNANTNNTNNNPNSGGGGNANGSGQANNASTTATQGQEMSQNGSVSLP